MSYYEYIIKKQQPSLSGVLLKEEECQVESVFSIINEIIGQKFRERYGTKDS